MHEDRQSIAQDRTILSQRPRWPGGTVGGSSASVALPADTPSASTIKCSPVGGATASSVEILVDGLQIPTGFASTRCHCLSDALRLQESFYIAESQCTFRTVGRMLQTVKQMLSQFHGLVECLSCRSISHFIMLIIVLAQRMTSCFRMLLTMLTEQYNMVQSRKALGYSTKGLASGPAEPEGDRQMLIQDYDLEHDEEPCLFGALTLVQLKRLKNVLAVVREVSREQNWISHVPIVDETQELVKKQIGLFDKTKE